MAEEELIAERKKKLANIRELGINPFPYSYTQTDHSEDIHKEHKHLEKEQKSGKQVSIAGRVMSMRKMGKAAFFDVQDWTGKTQVFLRKDSITEKEFNLFKNLDIADWVGVKGEVFRTKMGEISVECKQLDILGKSLRPLPDKFHGLKDKEIRYRKRYLDLITNPEVMQLFKQRAKIISIVRNYLNNLKFIEVETPVLQTLYGGTNAKPFKTHINAYDMGMYLRIAPELYLKRAVVGGFERVYEIARNFRNEGVDQTHNPEFSMIEWYEMYADYHTMMDRCEDLIRIIAKELYGKEEITVHGKKVDVSKKWPRLSLKDALKQLSGIDLDVLNDEQLLDTCKQHKADVKPGAKRGHLVFALFDKVATEYLEEPTWIIDYPKEVSPLAKPHREHPELVERFECYIGGKELCDGWSEVIDPEVQKQKFSDEQEAMRSGVNDEAHPVDDDFLTAMEHGMPTLGGIGMGIDRLVMFMTDTWSIRDVLLFPTMKPENE
jgi:lysyl-tRNA synthetase, class II